MYINIETYNSAAVATINAHDTYREFMRSVIFIKTKYNTITIVEYQ